MQRLLEASEKAKVELSSLQEVLCPQARVLSLRSPAAMSRVSNIQ